ncbi:MAG: outer membrane lipoprotein carrier protein LolA [Nitrospirota bacterium]
MSQIKINLLISISLSFFLVSFSNADVIDDLKARQGEIKTVSAHFTQEKHTRLFAKPIKTYGRFFYKQPDGIRWEYMGNVNMHVIYNGKELWIYYPDLKEADKFNGIQQYSSLIHFDISSMSADYDIRALKGKNSLKMTFTPRRKGPVNLIEMEFAGNSFFPDNIKLTDSSGEETIIRFQEVRLNSDISDEVFRFIPDSRVIVRERSVK